MRGLDKGRLHVANKMTGMAEPRASAYGYTFEFIESGKIKREDVEGEQAGMIVDGGKLVSLCFRSSWDLPDERWICIETGRPW